MEIGKKTALTCKCGNNHFIGEEQTNIGKKHSYRVDIDGTTWVEGYRYRTIVCDKCHTPIMVDVQTVDVPNL